MNAKNLLNDINKSYTPFHVVETASEQLIEKGFIRLDEGKSWKLCKGEKYFVTKNGSALIAFKVGDDKFNIVAAHTDSPVFKLKAKANMTVAEVCKLNVESYGGGIYGSWFDRKLGIAGRVVVKDGDGVKSVLVEGGVTVVIPSLAVHYNRAVNDGVAINVQRDMLPVISDKNITIEQLFTPQTSGKKILDYDLFLYVKEEPYFYGVDDCFMASPRLDDLEGSFGGLYALLNSDNKNTAVLALFDNEEVGSATKQGAGSTFLVDTLRRICLALGWDQYGSFARSMLVSMDNAHAKHPNRPELGDPTNDVVIGGGIVIKHHANQNYTTDGISAAIIKNIFDGANVRYQDFYMRSDLRCGGTLGAISSGRLSVTSVDIGLAQWAMHSAVESAGSSDFEQLVNGLKAFFNASNELNIN